MSSPNIVFCHVDQLRWDAISVLKHPYVSTPNLDEIMQAGTSFLRAQASHPVCCPSRTSWYTGRMPSEHGTYHNGRKVDKNFPDLGQWMSPRGYECYYVGRWHVPGRDVESGFHMLHPHYQIGEHADEACASIAEQFLANYKGGKPFFLNVGLLNPHDCCYMTDSWKMPCMKFGLEEFIAGELPPLPPGYDPKRPILRDSPLFEKPDYVRLHNYVYYRMVEAVDEAVGRVFHALEHSRFADNTIFIFSSDHGEMLGGKNWFGKNTLADGSLRVPLTIVAPGRVAPNVRDQQCLTGGVDVTATILDYAGVEMMPRMSVARSLRPVLEGRAKTVHDYLPAETTIFGPHVSIRLGDYKSIIDLPTGKLEIYNTARDPLEEKDLAGENGHAGVADEHRAMLADYQKRVEYCAAYKDIVANPSAGRGAGNGDDN